MPESCSVGLAFRLQLTATLRLRHLLALDALSQTSTCAVYATGDAGDSTKVA